jgi:Na+/proline symporter
VVHGTDKNPLAALLIAAASATTALLLAVAVVPEESVLAGRLRWPGRLLLVLLRLGLLVVGLLALGLLRLGTAGLIPLAATATAMCAVSLVLPLGGIRCLGLRLEIRRRLRLVLLCCHACTSWCDGLYDPIPFLP